ncbi:hypothetical protein CEK25_002419 [Fusarium fujikuroi]|nr:hypothetical protein CEK25_002419 [Fusarium fujikuroi]
MTTKHCRYSLALVWLTPLREYLRSSHKTSISLPRVSQTIEWRRRSERKSNDPSQTRTTDRKDRKGRKPTRVLIVSNVVEVHSSEDKKGPVVGAEKGQVQYMRIYVRYSQDGFILLQTIIDIPKGDEEQDTIYVLAKSQQHRRHVIKLEDCFRPCGGYTGGAGRQRLMPLTLLVGSRSWRQACLKLGHSLIEKASNQGFHHHGRRNGRSPISGTVLRSSCKPPDRYPSGAERNGGSFFPGYRTEHSRRRPPSLRPIAANSDLSVKPHAQSKLLWPQHRSSKRIRLNKGVDLNLEAM